MDTKQGAKHLLGCAPSHFAETIIREILSLTFFDRLQNEAGDEFGLVAIAVIGPPVRRRPDSPSCSGRSLLP